MNEKTTPGPASGTADEKTMKMPVPIVAPMPKSESWNSVIVRFSSPPSVSAPVSAAIAATGLRRRTCSCSDAIAPPRSVDVARQQVVPGLAPHHEPGRRRPRANTTGILRLPL